MSKELEAFSRIMEIYGKTKSLEGTYDDFLTIKKALQRLEAIDNSNPSEALEHFNHLEKWYRKICYHIVTSFKLDKDLVTIKQTLLKAQEQEKVLNIIKNKNVDTKYLISIIRDKAIKDKDKLWIYNSSVSEEDELSDEEFDLLKEVFKDE